MFRNSLCVDPECTQDCAHRGPRGQYCFFDHEKALCALLGIDWRPAFTFEELCDRLSHRIQAADPAPEALVSQIAERMQPQRPPAMESPHLKLASGGDE